MIDVDRERIITKKVDKEPGTYLINEIFYSLQGEGFRAGSANVFVRFAKCNLACSFCDTEYETGRIYTLSALIDKIATYNCKNIIFTGGEPSLQIDSLLIATLSRFRYYLAIETNGLSAMQPWWTSLNWIVVAPKTKESSLKVEQCQELKYPIRFGDELPIPSIPSQLYYLSPIVEHPESEYTRKNLEWCIKLVKANPTWRLSMQQHKIWRVR